MKPDEIWEVYKYIWQRFPNLVLVVASLEAMVAICVAYRITH